MYHATMPTDALLQVRAALFATRDFGFEKVREERDFGGDACLLHFMLPIDIFRTIGLPAPSRFPRVHS